jgi:F0F1-type ATP synthase membrane subunit b/b'
MSEQFGDDGYDEYDEYDEIAYQPHDDTESVLLHLRALLEEARQMPLSASVMVNRDQMLELVDAGLALLPTELKEARWLLRERDEYLARAQREAEALIEAGRVRAERMVERTEVVREARRAAERIVDEAEDAARKLKHEAEDYVDQKLAAFEVVLERTTATVKKGRERLQVHTGSPRLEATGTEPDAEADAFFDQDLA